MRHRLPAVDRLARLGSFVLVLSVVVGLAGGFAIAVFAPEDTAPAPPPTTVCQSPPCFNLDGIPNAWDTPSVLAALCYAAAVVLGVPSALAGLRDASQARWLEAGHRLLVFVGPALFLVGTEILPHLLLPCGVLPAVCEPGNGGFGDVAGRWHQLDHSLVGALPMAVLYWLALRRWRPDLLHPRGAPA